MERALIIDTKNTSVDWDLLLTRQEIGIPKPKMVFIHLPGGDGSIDLTGALTGDINYENREMAFEFDLLCPPAERASIIASFGAFIQGKKRKLFLPDDPDWYYLARLEITEYKTNGMIAALEVEAICEPYKYYKDKTVINDTIPAGGSKVITCENTRKTTVPTFTASAEVSVTFAGSTYTIPAGTITISNILFIEGTNSLTFAGPSGTTIQIEYQKGAI